MFTNGRSVTLTNEPLYICVDWGWKYFKDKKIAVDWCGAYDVNLSNCIFSWTWKILYIRCQCVKEFYVFHFVVACFTTREHNLYYIGNFIHTYAEAYLEPNQTSTMEIFRESS